MENSDKQIVLITAHDAERIVKSEEGLEPLHVLSYTSSDTLCPQFHLRGKNYALGVTDAHKYEQYIKKSKKELEEYKKLVEIWNKNFAERGSFIEFTHFILKKVEDKL